jgi:hypothetical protein
MILFIYLLLSYGITNILVYGSIFNFWREFLNKVNPSFLGKLFSCPMCLSTWVGFILSFIFMIMGYQSPMSLYGIDNPFLRVFLDGCLTSGGVWIIHNIEEAFERAFPTYED